MSATTKSIKKHLIGRPLRSVEMAAQRYGVLWGLPVLSSDAISSVAYACEEILIVLFPVLGVLSYRYMLGAAGVIVTLLLILILCYRQVIDAYPRGGGAYSVARGNLGKTPSLVAASGLVIDYVLTVAVSVCSGVAAVISAFPSLEAYRVVLALLFIVLLTVGNLRGLRESSVSFGLPAYVFILSIFVMIVTGLVKVAMGQVPTVDPVFAQTSGDISLFLLLHAFSSGCSALTGVEAISNSVSNFSNPAQRKAKATLSILGLIVLIVFGGVCVLAALYHASPQADVTVVAQIATGVFGAGSFMFYLVQVVTAMILLLAANTAYNGLPQLTSLLAEDGYLPKRFADRGSRLVYSNGIMFVALFAGLLVVLFHAQTHLLIPLYAAGVFLSFTLAQGGMVVHWKKERGRGWVRKAVINGSGAAITTVVFSVIVITRFSAGAWIALVAIALCVACMWGIHRHYERVSASFAFAEDVTPRSLLFENVPKTHVIVAADVVNKPFIKTLNYARGLSDAIEVYHVKTCASAARRFKTQYHRLGLDIPLVIEKAPYRNMNEVLLEHVDLKLASLGEGETVTIVLPRLITPWWDVGLHNQTAVFLENALLARRDAVVVTVPYIVR